mmetsp:Transcript_29669/g.64611  ORF Transcript_29669/g.64611 Transcript_29669/m.64611 type:complete len:700 (+) Transcript_29669:56-2155(+)
MARMNGSMQALLRLVIATLGIVLASSGSTPHFKWGQTKELVFLTVMVRDLVQDSVILEQPDVGSLTVRAKSSKGEELKLQLALREDVVTERTKWEVGARPEKWGMPVVITMTKVNVHYWDRLLTDVRPFKGYLDKDWIRGDPMPDPEDEVAYGEDNKAVVMITEKNFNKTIAKFSPLVVNVRYPWCTECKAQDATFIKAAGRIRSKAKSKKTAEWAKAGMGIIDAREERQLARWLNAECSHDCKLSVFGSTEEEPLTIKVPFLDTELVESLEKYLAPAVLILEQRSELDVLKARNTTCFGAFASKDSPGFLNFRRVARSMQGDLLFAATFGEEGGVEIWPYKDNSTVYKYDGAIEENATAFEDWVRPRALPLLHHHDYKLRDRYEKLNMPMAKVWFNDTDSDPALERIVRHSLRRVAKKFVGRIYFVLQTMSMHKYELREFGLTNPEVYPCFGIASNSSYNALAYAFEVTPDIAPSVLDFWKNADEAVPKLVDFCDRVLAGTWPQAHQSAQPETNWTAGTMRKLTWKQYAAEVLNPSLPLLMQVYTKHRAESDRRLKEVEFLATALADKSDAFTVASYDTVDNWVNESDFVKARGEYPGAPVEWESDWYWIPKAAPGKPRGPTIRMPRSKSEKYAPIKAVVQFAKKHANVEIDVEAVVAKVEELIVQNPPPPKQFDDDDYSEDMDEPPAAAAGPHGAEL